MPQDPSERRKHVRRVVLLPCRVEGADTCGPMQVIDLSEGGCFVATTNRFSAGIQLTLQIRLGASDVALTGRIAHSRPGRGFAVEFVGLPQGTLERLEDFLFQGA